MADEAILLGPERGNVGVFTPVSEKSSGRSRLAVISLTAGLIHHVGPHRLHVLLARSLAEAGIASLRLDQSGIGDSATRTDGLPAQEIPLREVDDAIAELERRGFSRFVLFGICSGAMHALRAANGNPKIAGLVLVNTGSDDGHAEVDSQAAAQFYLRQSIRNPNAWKNLLTGKVRYSLLFNTLFSVTADKIRRKSKPRTSIEENLRAMLEPYARQGTSILSVMSDRHAQYYQIYEDAYRKLQSRWFTSLIFPQTDHLFTSLEFQQQLIDQVCAWVGNLDEADIESPPRLAADVSG